MRTINHGHLVAADCTFVATTFTIIVIIVVAVAVVVIDVDNVIVRYPNDTNCVLYASTTNSC